MLTTARCDQPASATDAVRSATSARSWGTSCARTSRVMSACAEGATRAARPRPQQAARRSHVRRAAAMETCGPEASQLRRNPL